MRCFYLASVLLLALVISAWAADFEHDHSSWDKLLQKHVSWVNNGTASQVDYAGFASDRDGLQDYLESLSSVSRQQFDGWSRDEQLAFLINAYNAFTVKLILSNWPDIDSIRDLGSLFTSPWKLEFFQLLGKKHHLDWLEHEMIRGSGRYNDPLIHFAVNCASIGCPPLRTEAFVAERLDAQLLDSTRRFLMDRSRNVFDRQNKLLKVSSIFDWYEEDFQKGWRGYDSLQDFFATHADWLSNNEQVRQTIRQGNHEIKFLPYDWGLNSQ